MARPKGIDVQESAERIVAALLFRACLTSWDVDVKVLRRHQVDPDNETLGNCVVTGHERAEIKVAHPWDMTDQTDDVGKCFVETLAHEVGHIVLRAYAGDEDQRRLEDAVENIAAILVQGL